MADRTIPHDFEPALADALGQRLPTGAPEHLVEHIREAVKDVLEYRLEPRIPAELLIYNEADWTKQNRPGRDPMGSLAAYQAYNEECVRWCQANRVWSGDFEPMQKRQRAQLEQAGNA